MDTFVHGNASAVQQKTFLDYLLDGDTKERINFLDTACNRSDDTTSVWAELAQRAYGCSQRHLRQRLYVAWKRQRPNSVRCRVLASLNGYAGIAKTGLTNAMLPEAKQCDANDDPMEVSTAQEPDILDYISSLLAGLVDVVVTQCEKSLTTDGENETTQNPTADEQEMTLLSTKTSLEKDKCYAANYKKSQRRSYVASERSMVTRSQKATTRKRSAAVKGRYVTVKGHHPAVKRHSTKEHDTVKRHKGTVNNHHFSLKRRSAAVKNHVNGSRQSTFRNHCLISKKQKQNGRAKGSLKSELTSSKCSKPRINGYPSSHSQNGQRNKQNLKGVKSGDKLDNLEQKKIVNKARTGGCKNRKRLKQQVDDSLLLELDDIDIHRAMDLLRSQYPHLAGLEHAGLGVCIRNQSIPRFSAADGRRFVQILNVGDHWVCVTNVFGTSHDDVYVYDSLFRSVSQCLVLQVSSILRCQLTSNTIMFHVRDFHQQKPGTRWCGYYAVAAAFAICQGVDPTGTVYSKDLLHDAVKQHLDGGDVGLIPGVASELKRDVNKLMKLKLYCLCQRRAMGQMLQCRHCLNWFHTACVVDLQLPLTADGDLVNGPCCVNQNTMHAEAALSDEINGDDIVLSNGCISDSIQENTALGVELL